MKSAEKHPLESDRLKALQNTHLLDSLPEEDFDSITRLASFICDTPIALFSLVDENRQWFKSRVGLSATETPRDVAFCAHAILQDDVFLVSDSSKDDRFRDNPLVTDGPKVAFYAGAPVLDPTTKLPLGTLCTIDNKPKTLSSKQTEALKTLAEQVSKLILVRAQLKEQSDLNKKLKHKSAAIDTMTEGVVIQDHDGRITEFNTSALKILGLTEDQILGRTSTDPLWAAIKPDGTPFPGDQHPAMISLRTGKPILGAKMGVRSTHIKERWISINSTPVFEKNAKTPTSVVTTFTDITELQSAQENLVENARFVSLAEMASGVAHEINNPLSIIVGSHSILSKTIDKLGIQDESITKHLQKIKETVFRISKIVRGLQTFSRDASKEKSTNIILNDVVEDTLAICAERFKKGAIDLRLDIPEKTQAHANFIKLGQVILNLLTNSFDAITELPEKWIQIKATHEGDIIKIRVSDSGAGIPNEVVQKMFLPFFTTKPIGKGTGLGLSIGKGMIEDMGGKFYYDASAANTTFVIELKPAQKI